jgi:hypothetical protein
MVAGPADSHGGALNEVLVDVTRAAAAIRVEQDADSPGFRIAWITAEGILADQSLVEQQVDVGPGLPGRQIAAVRVD